MSNTNQPPKKVVPFPVGKLDQIVKSKPLAIPEELKQLDGQPIASVQPENNFVSLPEVKVVRGQETANSADFNLFEDGTLMKFLEIPDRPPQCFLVDGAGRQFGIARNPKVADMICNAVNATNLARVMMLEEERAKLAEENKGGPPPALLLPPVTPGGDK